MKAATEAEAAKAKAERASCSLPAASLLHVRKVRGRLCKGGDGRSAGEKEGSDG